MADDSESTVDHTSEPDSSSSDESTIDYTSEPDSSSFYESTIDYTSEPDSPSFEPSEDPWDTASAPEQRPLFEQTFTCISFSRYKNPGHESGDKIIMPASSLSEITSLRLTYPLTFQLESYNDDTTMHCSVLEFEAEEYHVYVPDWMMQNLKLREGDAVIVRSAQLARGSYMKLQPHTGEFNEHPNPKELLESTLSKFTCLSKGDTIVVRDGDTKRDYRVDVLEVSPGDAVCLIDTDCEVDFALPLDYKEPEVKKLESVRKEKESVSRPQIEEKKVETCSNVIKEADSGVFRPFTGRAQRLDGESVVVNEEEGGSSSSPSENRMEAQGNNSKKDEFKPFTGRSHVLGG